MNYKLLPNEVVRQLRERYPEGTRVELVSMDDPYSKLVPGDRGTVSCIDDAGTIFVGWDKGSSLGLVYNADQFKTVENTLAHGAHEAVNEREQQNDLEQDSGPTMELT